MLRRYYCYRQSIALMLAICFLPVAYAESPSSKKNVSLPTVEVMHFWISQSEGKALDIYRRAWEGSGGKWEDMPARDRQTELKIVSDRIANGYPPTAMQWHANEGAKELPAMGVIQDIEEVATADHWRDFLPPNVIDLISYKGRIYFAPVNIHAENWLWTNKRIFDRLHLSPPTSWHEVLDSAAKIKAAGYTPIALGSSTWEVALIFNDIVYSVYGPAGYARLMNGSSPNAALEPAMLKALDIFRRLRAFAHPGRAGKTWADAAISVGRGQAGMQFLGDYAKGELMAAGFVVDKDFRCTLAPGTESVYFIIVDSFAFPIGNNKLDRRSQLLFARHLMNVDNQLAFNRIKGSIPVRADIQRKDLDTCGKIGLDFISGKNKQISAQSMVMSSQMSQEWMDIVAEYFNDPKITPVNMQRQLADVLSQK